MQEISVASILDRQRQETEEEGRQALQKTLAMWLESRFGSAAGKSLSRLVGRDPKAAKLSRVAELLAEARDLRGIPEASAEAVTVDKAICLQV